jgi:restriction system protein
VDALPVASGTVAGVDALRLDQFELLIGEIFRRQGYTVELSAAVNAEDGIDLVLRRDSETIPVQCKHWKMAHVTERELREFYGAMAASGAPRGIFVTTGGFAVGVDAFARDKGIELMAGNDLAQSIAAAARPGENLCHVPEWLDEFVAHARIFDPECPVCHGTMVIRHNRANGTPSWTCRGYPRCPGRREPRLDLLPHAAAN